VMGSSVASEGRGARSSTPLMALAALLPQLVMTRLMMRVPATSPSATYLRRRGGGGTYTASTTTTTKKKSKKKKKKNVEKC